MNVRFFASVLSAIIFSQALVGCEGSDVLGGYNPSDAGDMAVDTHADTSTSEPGKLTVIVDGLPADASADLSLVAAGGFSASVSEGVASNLDPGNYTVEADRLRTDGNFVDGVYAPESTSQSVEVRAGTNTTVTVSYGLVETSEKLWVPSNNSDFIFGIDDATLASDFTSASVTMSLEEGFEAVSFDAAGRLWVANTDETEIQMFEPSEVTALNPSATKTFDVSSSLQNIADIAFGPNGGLWVSDYQDAILIYLAPDTLSTGGSPTADRTITSSDLSDPRGLAFDADDSLWVVDELGESAVEFTRGQLETGGMDIDASTVVTLDIGTSSRIFALAFDRTGDLWISDLGPSASEVHRVDSGNLQTSRMIAPGLSFEVGAVSTPTGLAFDNQNGLWVADGSGKLVRYAKSDIGDGTTVTPDVTWRNADALNVPQIAFFPAPEGLPHNEPQLD